MHVIDRVADPELSELSSRVTSALIDGTDTPDFTFQLADELDRERTRARDLLFSGQDDQAVTVAEAAIERVESAYADNPGVPRYFNSYAERVVYNRLFATDGEPHGADPRQPVLRAHRAGGPCCLSSRARRPRCRTLTRWWAYAPAYPFSHMKLAVQLARNEDWDSARAACLNALRVALDRDDAAFAYYRLAYAEWMRDRFDIAAAAYIMSEHIAPGQIGALDGELRELLARAESQCIAVPTDVESAAGVLRMPRSAGVAPHPGRRDRARRRPRVRGRGHVRSRTDAVDGGRPYERRRQRRCRHGAVTVPEIAQLLMPWRGRRRGGFMFSITIESR